MRSPWVREARVLGCESKSSRAPARVPTHDGSIPRKATVMFPFKYRNALSQCLKAIVVQRTRRKRQPFAKRRRPLTAERLEDRVTPAATVYVDFGFNFPAGRLTVTDAQMSMGTINGPTVFGAGHTIVPLLTTVQNQTIDLTGDGVSDIADAQLLGGRIIEVMERAFAPLDITVRIASTANITDVANTL